MPAKHYDQITDQMIRDRIDSVEYVSISSCGRSASSVSSEELQAAAENKLYRLEVAEVRDALQNELWGDTAEQEIDMAISICLEGHEEWPDNVCVSIRPKI